MIRRVLYVAAPLAPTEEEIRAQRRKVMISGFETTVGSDEDRPLCVHAALSANVKRAGRWLSWLRGSFPETTFIAPRIAAAMCGADDADPSQREAGIVDACAVIERCDGIVLCGPRVSIGMTREVHHGLQVGNRMLVDNEGEPFDFVVYDLTMAPSGNPPVFPPGERTNAKTFVAYMEAWAMALRSRGPE